MNILLLCDDEYHPGSIPADGMQLLDQSQFSITTVMDCSEFDPTTLSDYDAIVMSKCDHISATDKASWKTPAVVAAFIDYVATGGGLIVSHSGTVKGPDTAPLDELAGCYFAWHPNNCPVTVAPLKPHPITEGVGIFTEVDEHYHLHMLTTDVDVLCASYAPQLGDPSKFEKEPYFNAPAHIAPSVLLRTHGKGKVCTIAPGHTAEVWSNPQFQKLLTNALLAVKQTV